MQIIYDKQDVASALCLVRWMQGLSTKDVEIKVVPEGDGKILVVLNTITVFQDIRSSNSEAFHITINELLGMEKLPIRDALDIRRWAVLTGKLTEKK